MMHPNFLGIKKGIKKQDIRLLPSYVDYEELLRDLEGEQ